MPALAGAAILFWAVALYLRGLRDRGGWFEVNRLRRGLPTRTPQPAWEELFPIERGWFYGVPIFGSLGVVFTIIGIVVLIAG